MVDVSVVIVSYNTKDLTLKAISSVNKEGSKLRKEIVVIDNGSNDGSVTELAKLKQSIKLITNDKNLGFSKANNQGIIKSSGKYVFLLNPDAMVTKGTIKKLYDFAEKTSSVGAIGPRLVNPDGSVQSSAFRSPTLLRAVKQYWLGKKGLLDKYVPVGKQPIEVENLVMAALLLTPEALKVVGKLDERYFMYFEDLDYCKRIRDNGLKVYYHPGCEVVHEHGASGKSLAKNSDQWRRLIPSSKIYHGLIRHSLISFVIWSSTKWRKMSNL